MGLFDALDGSAAKKAGRLNQIAIGAGIANGTTALNTGATNALGLLGTGTDGSGGNALSALNSGLNQARTDINAGYAGAQPALAKLGSLYDPMTQQGASAYSAFGDATGANGAEGSARATESFRAAPGYEYTQNQALEALQRSAAARGGLAGGNLTKDILTTATGLADQGWNSYINNLKTGSDYYTQGLAGQGAGATALANASIGQGTQLGALGTAQGAGAASLYGQGAGVQSGLGTSLANLQLGGINATTANNNAVAKAQTDASSNFLGALFGGAKTLAGSNIFG